MPSRINLGWWATKGGGRSRNGRHRVWTTGRGGESGSWIPRMRSLCVRNFTRAHIGGGVVRIRSRRCILVLTTWRCWIGSRVTVRSRGGRIRAGCGAVWTWSSVGSPVVATDRARPVLRGFMDTIFARSAEPTGLLSRLIAVTVDVQVVKLATEIRVIAAGTSGIRRCRGAVGGAADVGTTGRFDEVRVRARRIPCTTWSQRICRNACVEGLASLTLNTYLRVTFTSLSKFIVRIISTVPRTLLAPTLG